MNKILEQYSTASKNVADLTPNYVNRNANIKLLNKLEEINRGKLAKNQYNFKSMVMVLNLDKLKICYKILMHMLLNQTVIQIQKIRRWN